MIKKGKYLSSILLRPDATLKEAMLKMNKTSYKIIFIASKNFKLLGTLTDGDIRRSLAEGVLPSSKIANFYNEHLKNTSLILPKENKHNYHSYYVYVIQHPKRDLIIKKLIKENIYCNISYPFPIHTMKGYSYLNYKKGSIY